MAAQEGAPAHGTVAHLLPITYKRLVAEWLEEDTPSFDYGGFVVGDEESEARLLGKSEVSIKHCATVRGPVRKLLLGERVALNTLARCSGIATKSARLLALLRKAGYENILAGTRKTTPGFRLVEKYGMLVGGVDQHRVDLSAMTMLKDNHIVAAGSITNAVRAAKAAGGFAIKVEVECQSFEEADEAIAAGADIVMLDNFSPDGVEVAAADLKDKWGRGTGDRKAFLVEVSGGLTEENVEAYVCKDVDISSHSDERDNQSATPRVSTSRVTGFTLSVPETSSSLSFSVNVDRLLDLYYENFNKSIPVALPIHFLTRRRSIENHGMEDLLLVLHWIGSIYAPWTPSDGYYAVAYQALLRSTLPRNPFSVQALLLFAIAQHHCDFRPESRKMLDVAIAITLELGMNQQGFARQYGEGDPVLEESWRRTYFWLHHTDQHFAVVTTTPMYSLMNVPNLVDLPCDDEYYEVGEIPPAVTWQEYEVREFADVEVIYSSTVYLHDICRVVAHIMKSFVQTGTFGEALISSVDTKVAVWNSLLPASKKDPLRPDGKVDEVMFLAQMISVIVTMNTHRPFSSLVYSLQELSTKSFASPVPFVESMRQTRAAHTSRALKAADMHTKLLAIPCTIEHHHLYIMCITASIAAAQVSACNNLLDDHALSIARDRVRLSIGFLNAMGSTWPLGKVMANEVRAIARSTLAGPSSQTSSTQIDQNAEIEVPRDDLIWPICSSATEIDIYSGIVIPMEWDTPMNQPSSSSIVPPYR
ncbi:nicotinate-nucleotide diphosphorylase [Amniculicola lignicola CBS 123094]|uniref:Nicotinate-nucleotide pyrophosphorylase [carboxylating] n=1 Tax=Amniculicola lignicola CBS 123094 TaxID=1392246 RepID=A0A6A5WI43_9PLEO|nr:nicotinate-nucleotide diphosphorylase [Amniculicola lignicola CBS 123094]